MMDSRRERILKCIVDEYVRTAEPVSSKQVCERADLDCSPATVRNDMAALEEAGYIAQPHTSAGRVPTEKAYKHYIASYVGPATGTATKPARPAVQIRVTLRIQPRQKSSEERMHEIGLALAQASGDAVMLATTRPWSETVGIANLLRKPDFQEVQARLALADSLEKLDATLRGMAKTTREDVQIILGSDSPFGPALASVVIGHTLPDGGRGVMGIVGPMRMDYAHNAALLMHAKRLIEPQALTYG
ncbi:DeoR family transcriptional regulator [Patescibacteria group bacterium]|nr:DeoR family transcriptional regulator [Patescibacteria group bacterium]